PPHLIICHFPTRRSSDLTLFKSETMRIVLIGLHENAELKPHKANGVINVQVLQGKIEFTAGQQNTHLERGQMVALQDNITHSVRSEEHTSELQSREISYA